MTRPNQITRMYVGEAPKSEVEEIVMEFFEGFTVIPATGVYKGEREASNVVEIAHNDELETKEALKTLKDRLATEFNQESILMVRTQAVVVF